MNISLDQGRLYVDNYKFCFYEVPNGSSNLPIGNHPVEARLSHNHGRVLPLAANVGWLGSSSDCAIVLGKVIGRNSLIPDEDAVERLVRSIEATNAADQLVILRIT